MLKLKIIGHINMENLFDIIITIIFTISIIISIVSIIKVLTEEECYLIDCYTILIPIALILVIVSIEGITLTKVAKKEIIVVPVYDKNNNYKTYYIDE